MLGLCLGTSGRGVGFLGQRGFELLLSYLGAALIWAGYLPLLPGWKSYSYGIEKKSGME